jgi:hypothetical protein
MPRLKELSFRQFLKKKDHKTYRHFRYAKIFSIQDMFDWVDEWEKEKLKIKQDKKED